MYKGNKGEWSELYVFFKILGDGFIISADKYLNIIEDYKYPVEEVLRENLKNINLVYKIMGDLGKVFIYSDDKELITFQQDEAIKKANELLETLKKKQKNAFEVPEVADFLKKIFYPKMKASSLSKRDITLVIRDFKNNIKSEVGFSIKSKLGGNSTLFNAGKGTCFEYNVIGLDECTDDVKKQAKKLKAGELVNFLYKNNCTLEYSKTKSEKFLNNLMIIDSMLDKIMAALTLGHYLKKGDVIDIVKYIEEKNPCNYNAEVISSFYAYKVKQFLFAAALGMTAQSDWQGIIDVTGGYLIVKENGEIVCYHVYNWNDLQEYLYHSTKLETASTSRHDFGYLYEKNGKFNIDLNLQIRFKNK